MEIQTNLKGRKRNTKLSPKNPLVPLFEAVINSIQAIEETGIPMREGHIDIHIVRNGTEPLPMEVEIPENVIFGFKIEDNGIGFNTANLASFNTLDSDYKIAKGCRGVGRLLWLKAFQRVTIKSVYQDADRFMVRHLIFDEEGVKEERASEVSEAKKLATVVYLENIDERYRSHLPQSVQNIAQALFEHYLWYFIQPGGAPHIAIYDGTTRILLDEIYEQSMLTDFVTETIQLKNQIFELTHIKLRHSRMPPTLFYCAAHRPVRTVKLEGKVAGLFGRIEMPPDGDFDYICHVSSHFLDEHVQSDRTDFDIAEELDTLLAQMELSFQDINTVVILKITEYLKEHLEANKQASRHRVQRFVDNRAPRYRPVLSRIPEDQLCVNPACPDKELELTLHKHFAKLEEELLIEGHQILDADEYGEDYQKQLEAYLSKADAVKKSELAAYVFHRKVVLDILGKLLQRTATGKYVDENIIHQLIMPMRKESGEIDPDRTNLWLIDEKLAFHNYLASDKAITSMPITGSNSKREPDLLALEVFDTPTLISEIQGFPLAAITVIELKKPMRNNMSEGEDKNPLEQVLGYLDRVRKGGVLTAEGRPIPQSENIPGFCYVVCDLTESMIERCRLFDLTPTSDQMGYFGYNKHYKAYIEVIAYDKLIKDAHKRNRAFFDKLGLPTNQ